MFPETLLVVIPRQGRVCRAVGGRCKPEAQAQDSPPILQQTSPLIIHMICGSRGSCWRGGGGGGRRRGGGRWNSGGLGPIQRWIPVGRKSWCRGGWPVGGMDVMEGGRRPDDGRVLACPGCGGGVDRGKRGGSVKGFEGGGKGGRGVERG